MAARYWVGGTGNWSDATNHWSDTSGGSPGAGFLPTSSDDVYLDNNSHTTNFTLTLDVNSDCLDFNTSELTTRICFFTNPTNDKVLSIYGSITIYSNLIGIWGGNAMIIFKATTSETIDITGTGFYSNVVQFNGIGGTWTFISDANLIKHQGIPTYKI